MVVMNCRLHYVSSHLQVLNFKEGYEAQNEVNEQMSEKIEYEK